MAFNRKEIRLQLLNRLWGHCVCDSVITKDKDHEMWMLVCTRGLQTEGLRVWSKDAAWWEKGTNAVVSLLHESRAQSVNSVNIAWKLRRIYFVKSPFVLVFRSDSSSLDATKMLTVKALWMQNLKRKALTYRHIENMETVRQSKEIEMDI